MEENSINSKENLKLQWKCYKPLFMVLVSLCVALLLLVVGLTLQTHAKFLENAMSPYELLAGYCKWGRLIVFLMRCAIGIVTGFSMYAFFRVFINNQDLPFEVCHFRHYYGSIVVKVQTIEMIIVCMGMILFFVGAFNRDEKPLDRIQAFESEMEMIERNEYQSAEVYLHPEHYEKDSIWLFRDDERCRFVSYKAIGDEFSWDKIYVPDYMEFELDSENPYDEWQSVHWNEENAARYKITYTPNLKIVTEIETLPPHGPIERIRKFSDEISAKGYTKTITDKEDKKWVHNVSHIEFITGTVMDFSWEGPTMLGYTYGSSDRTFRYRDPETTWRYELYAWTSEYYDGIIKDVPNIPKEKWVKDLAVPYTEGAYFETISGEDIYEVMFAVENEEAKGYNYYLIDAQHELFYQFSYCENVNVYDDARARRVIESIKVVE